MSGFDCLFDCISVLVCLQIIQQPNNGHIVNKVTLCSTEDNLLHCVVVIINGTHWKLILEYLSFHFRQR